MTSISEAKPRLSREQREALVLDAAARLFYARGVHEVGMDELIRETGLGKATVYRLYPSKDELIGAYLRRESSTILGYVDRDIARHADDPAAAVRAIIGAIGEDVARAGFRGCRFNNASIEFSDPEHPARVAAREYRAQLHSRLVALGEQVRPGPEGKALGGQLAVVIDGLYTSASHLGAHGPAGTGPDLVESLLAQA